MLLPQEEDEVFVFIGRKALVTKATLARFFTPLLMPGEIVPSHLLALLPHPEAFVFTGRKVAVTKEALARFFIPILILMLEEQIVSPLLRLLLPTTPTTQRRGILPTIANLLPPT